MPDALIQSALAPYGLAATSELAATIRRYTQLLLLWNQKIDLTALTRPREILERHFGECMFAARVIPIKTGRLADVGSGAGFPGLALKLVCPGLSVTLIEPSHKKAVFLAEVRRELELSSVHIVRARVEEMEVPKVGFDFVTSRAIGRLDRLLDWASQALTKQGRIILWLGEDGAERLSTAGGWSWQEPIRVPLSQKRVLLVGSLSATA